MEELSRLSERLRPLAAMAWSRPANFHITIKFIGEWPGARLGELRAALDGLRARAPISITIRGLGFYPNARQPKIFWAGVEGPPALWELAVETNQALTALGIEAEERRYSPHLTLARNRDGASVSRLAAEVKRLGTPTFGSFTARSLGLYQSVPQGGGSVYTKLSEHKFFS